MTSYTSYEINDTQKQLVKDAIVADKITTYIGLHGEEPSISTVNNWYAEITDSKTNEYKNRFYSDLVSDELGKKEKQWDYLTFTCVETGGISLSNYGSNAPNIKYSLNGGDWTTWNYNNISLIAGDVVKMKGINNNGISSSSSKYSQFVMTGKIAASGNIMSLIDGEKNGTKIIPCNYCYSNMFLGCKNLTTAPELPATTLTNNCYFYMFSVCTGLTTPPELPATTLANGCYRDMFMGCTNLITAPELPATTLVNYCYYEMFANCINLKYIKAMFITTPTSGTSYWVYRVSSTGTFVKNSDATWTTTGVNGIPTGWTVETA